MQYPEIKNRIQKKYFVVFGILFLLVFAIVVFFLMSVSFGSKKTAGSEPRQLAASIIEICKNEEHRPHCYEREVPKLLDQIGFKGSFDVIRSIRNKDTEYAFCHVLAHDIGGGEVAEDPDQWIDVVSKCPQDGLCSNGCGHGAMVARFSDEVLSQEQIKAILPDLERVCEPRSGYDPTPLDKAICYHGLGHMNIHITGADIGRSIEICKQVVSSSFDHHSRLCIEGVYMQLFQPLEPEDEALIDTLTLRPTSENFKSFCKQYSSDIAEEGACWREGWPFFDEIFEPNGFEKYCSYMRDESQQQLCLSNVFNIWGRQSLGNPERIHDLCKLVSKQNKINCYTLGAQSAIEEDKSFVDEAIAVCASAPAQEIIDSCIDRLISNIKFNFRIDSPDADLFCSAVPRHLQPDCMNHLEKLRS